MFGKGGRRCTRRDCCIYFARAHNPPPAPRPQTPRIGWTVPRTRLGGGTRRRLVLRWWLCLPRPEQVICPWGWRCGRRRQFLWGGGGRQGTVSSVSRRQPAGCHPKGVCRVGLSPHWIGGRGGEGGWRPHDAAGYRQPSRSDATRPPSPRPLPPALSPSLLCLSHPGPGGGDGGLVWHLPTHDAALSPPPAPPLPPIASHSPTAPPLFAASSPLFSFVPPPFQRRRLPRLPARPAMGISANLTVRVVGRVRFTASPSLRGGGDGARAASRSASALAIPGLRLLTLGEDGVLRIEVRWSGSLRFGGVEGQGCLKRGGARRGERQSGRGHVCNE